MAAPLNYTGTVALGGSNVTLATAPAYASLVVGDVILSNTGTADVLVLIQDNAGTPNKLVNVYVPAGGSVQLNCGQNGDIRLLAGNTATLVVPAGTGNLGYTVTFH